MALGSNGIFTFTVAGSGESVSPVEVTSTFGSNSTALQPIVPDAVVKACVSVFGGSSCESTFRVVVWPSSPVQLLGIVR